MPRRGRTSPLPHEPEDKWKLLSERLKSLLPTAYGLLADWAFLWTIEAVLDDHPRPFPGGAYRTNAAGFLLTPLLISSILKVWILLFDDSNDTISLTRITETVRKKNDEAFWDLVRSKATEGSTRRTLHEALIALTDCTRSLKDFETHFSTDRNSFAAHVLERASKAYPVDLWMLAKVVPKTLHLVELLAELFGLPAMYFDNILGTHCMTAATLFGLQEEAEAPKRIFENRQLAFAEFESVVSKIVRASPKC